MGLLSIFSKEGREQRSRQRNIQRAVNKYLQSADRFKALQGLADDGSPEATFGLLRRFGVMYDKSIEDEQEKEWVFDVLVSKGAAILPEVERYLTSAGSISWPLRLLSKIADKEQELATVSRVLERHEPGYERDPTKKIQLLNHISGLEDARVTDLAAPYLADMDEGVRYAAAEALLRQGDETSARDRLIEHLAANSDESLRVRLLIADGFAERGWAIKARRAEVEARLPEQFTIDREGHLKKKAATAP